MNSAQRDRAALEDLKRRAEKAQDWRAVQLFLFVSGLWAVFVREDFERAAVCAGLFFIAGLFVPHKPPRE